MYYYTRYIIPLLYVIYLKYLGVLNQQYRILGVIFRFGKPNPIEL